MGLEPNFSLSHLLTCRLCFLEHPPSWSMK
eukprot:g54565.t1